MAGNVSKMHPTTSRKTFMTIRNTSGLSDTPASHAETWWAVPSLIITHDMTDETATIYMTRAVVSTVLRNTETRSARRQLR